MNSSEKRSLEFPLEGWDADLILTEIQSLDLGSIAWDFLLNSALIKSLSVSIITGNSIGSDPNVLIDFANSLTGKPVCPAVS